MISRHRARHSQENGRDGDVVFGPFEEVTPRNDGDFKGEAEALAKPPTDCGWLRFWILTDEKETFGKLTLAHKPPLKTALHRCLLMMGLERPVRGQGFGTQLMSEALAWAKEQPTLDWITLYVFENNPGAKALYSRFGFAEVGTTRDMFRVFGQSIDDTEMVLKLR